MELLGCYYVVARRLPGGFADKTGYLMVEVADKEPDFLIMMVADKDLINLNICVDVIVFWFT